MTVGDLIKTLKDIEDLEEKLRMLIQNKERWPHAEQKIKDLEQLISYYKAQQLDE
jgi:hypothetical protein